jgi:opacity protein-like surface antigen
MVSVKVAAIAGVAAVFATLANAADMPSLPPVNYPPIEESASGWYLRGDIGMSNQRVGHLFNVLYDTASSVNTVQKDFDSAPTFGLGIGYQWNNWLRTDVTGEYRGKANFHGFDIAKSGGSTFSDEYRGSKSEWLMLANIYADLGTWYSFTPFIGAGIGAAYNTISNFMDVCTVCAGGGVAYADTASKWNFAWAVHAGVSYRVNSRLSLEFAYRYVNLGDAMSGDIVTYTGTNAVYNPMEFKDISSHDLKFGVRWLLEPPVQTEPIMLPPLMRRG